MSTERQEWKPTAATAETILWLAEQLGTVRLPVSCPHCAHAGFDLVPVHEEEPRCPCCQKAGLILHPNSWLARQIVALAMDALGITYEDAEDLKAKPRRWCDAKDAEPVSIGWCLKEVQLRTARGEVLCQSPGIKDILQHLAEWVDEYLAGRADTYPLVTDDCTECGLTETLPPDYPQKLHELLRFVAEEDD